MSFAYPNAHSHPVGTVSDSGMRVGRYLTVAAGGFLPHRKGPLRFAVGGLRPRLRRHRILGDKGCPERDTVTMGNAGIGTSRLFAGRVLELRRLADGL